MARGFIQKKNNRYYVGLNTTTADGRRTQQWFGSYPTKRQAEQRRTEVLHAQDTGNLVAPSHSTVAEYLTDEWLPTKQRTLKPTTWHSYSSTIRNHVLPHLGQVPLQALTPAHLDGLYAHLLTSGRKNGTTPGLSATSVRYTHRILRHALADAVRKGRLSRNPADAADPPRPAPGAEMRFWTPDQVRSFLYDTRDHPLHALWRTATHTGMRRGELLALRWADLDLTTGRLAVTQALVTVRNQIQVSTPKTPKSRRNIDLDRCTVETLKAHRRHQTEQRLALGPGYRDQDLVFATADGGHLHPDTISKSFKQLVTQAALPTIRLHDLRHTHVAILAATDVPIRVISERLGHASVAFTLDRYGHILPGADQQAAQKFATAVGDL